MIARAGEGEGVEVIVVDDGSSDGSAAVVQEVCVLLGATSRVKLVALASNGGVAAALNEGAALLLLQWCATLWVRTSECNRTVV